MWQIWLIIVIILLIARYHQPSLLLNSCLIASMVILCTSFLLHHLLLETFVFFILTLLGNLIGKSSHTTSIPSLLDSPSNTNDLLGKTGILIHPIGCTPWQNGQIRIQHETLPATSYQTLERGTRVKVTAICGICLHVVPLTPTSCTTSPPYTPTHLSRIKNLAFIQKLTPILFCNRKR